MKLGIALIFQNVFLLAVSGQRVRPWTRRDCQRVSTTPPIDHSQPPPFSPTTRIHMPAGQTVHVTNSHAMRNA